jgi:hypothetical protein
VNTTPVIPPANGALTLYADGSFDYTPTVAAPNSDTFTYEVCDAEPLCSSAAVAITVTSAAGNEPPIAVGLTVEVQRGTTTTFNIVADDYDPDGTVDWTSVVITTGATAQRGGTVVNNFNGTVTYTTPSPGWRGTDTFQYTVNDNDGATSNTATVRINVVK